jgi:hypothetical protein
MQVEGRPWIFWSHVILRFFQFMFSLIALITLSAAFVPTYYYGYGSMLGSSAMTYVTIVTYTGMVYSLWFLIVISILRMCGHPPLVCGQVMDAVLAVMLLVGGIVLACSDYVVNCSDYGNMLRCNNIKAAVVFTFLAFATYVMTFVLGFWEYGKRDIVNDEDARYNVDVEHGLEGPTPTPYYSEPTPTV